MSATPPGPGGKAPQAGASRHGLGSLLRGTFLDLARLVRVYRRGWAGEPYGPAAAPGVAVVLGAQVLPGGRPSRVLAARVRHAARLYATGEVDLLIVTGGTGEHPPSEAEVMAGMLRRQGVAEAVVVLEDRAVSTWDSARRVAEISRRRGIEAVRVVTDPLHCVRAVEAFGQAGLPAVAEPVYASPMWLVRHSRRGQLAREIVAVVWYRTRYGVA